MTETTSGGDRTEQSAPAPDSGYVQNPEYTGEAGQDKYIYAGDAQTSGAAPGLQAKFSAPTPTVTSYEMGGKSFDRAPTDSQRMAAGLQGTQKYYAASGQVERAAEMGLQASRSRAAELAVKEGERADKKAVTNEQELQKFHSVMQSFQDPKTAAAYVIDAYSKNLGNYGQGEHKDQTIQFEATPDGGGKAWTVDASGKATSAPQVFNKDQIIKEAQSAYWRNTDPAGYAKAIEERDARAAARKVDFADKVSLEKVKAEMRTDLESTKTQGRIDVNAAKPPSAGRGGAAGLGGASKGAKFDIDGDGNRVILYRDGTMVYPKDASGVPVKIKAGTDQDQKLTRDLVKIYAGKTGMAPDDPVATAKDLTKQTKTGAAPAAEDKFVVGKQYKDAKGNIGTYAGNGQWK